MRRAGSTHAVAPGGDSNRRPAAGRHVGLATASLFCSAIPALITVTGFAKFLFEEHTHALSEDLLGLGIGAVLAFPLALVGFILAFWTKDLRPYCLGAALVYLLGMPILVFLVG
jgi:hypothetical protein